MPKTKIFFAISFLILATIACGLPFSSSQSELPRTEDDVPRVSVDVAKAALDSGAAVILDVRSIASYNESHVVGALSIPLDEIETNISNVGLDKEHWVITYCT